VLLQADLDLARLPLRLSRAALVVYDGRSKCRGPSVPRSRGSCEPRSGDVLHDLFGVRVVAGNSSRNPVDARGVALHQNLEGRAVTVFQALNRTVSEEASMLPLRRSELLSHEGRAIV